MADKTSREALLEMCTPIDVVRDHFIGMLQTASTKLDKIEREGPEKLEIANREFSSHGKFYRWFLGSEHKDRIESIKNYYEYQIKEAKRLITEWEKAIDDKQLEDGSFYKMGKLYVHNPPELWRDRDFYREMREMDEVEPYELHPIETTNDLRGGHVFLYGFEVEEVAEFFKGEHEEECYTRVSIPTPIDDGFSRSANFYPSRTDLLVILKKGGRIPCWVADNSCRYKTEYNGNSSNSCDGMEKWLILDPNHWKKLIGRKINLFGYCGNQPVYMPGYIWNQHFKTKQYYNFCIEIQQLETPERGLSPANRSI